MPNPVRLCLALHNHQPVGNFDHVFEQSYVDSYKPFLDVFDDYPELKISLHTSGPLMEWLDEHHPEYIDRLAAHVASGRIEIIGGAFFEPILTMIPPRDRVGQIATYTRWLENRLGANIRGMWMPERVWEQGLTADVADAGIKYTLLDDFHFRNAGLEDESLFGYYTTEDQGKSLVVFPGSEKLRYLIPFQSPHETVDYLREIGERHQNAVCVFGDDGEKFGTWPDTKKHVYEDGWLRGFFQQLTDNRDWLHTTTLSDALDSTGPVGKVYLPEGSYREMTEWALPTTQQTGYEDLVHEYDNNPALNRIKRFVRGGYWRNFKVKYPETDEMYTRMMAVSARLETAVADGHNVQLVEQARQELYRGQCNCSYWHGAFGGIYLPHLRNAVYRHLIAADNLLDQAAGMPEHWVEANADDYDFDGRPEVRLENDELVCLLRPAAGGQLYELDVRNICHNLLATLARRPETYHRKVLNGPSDNDGVASIHDRVVFKQEDLDQRLQYDQQMRKSLIDRFYAPGTSAEAVERGEAKPISSFDSSAYEAIVRRSKQRIQVMMSCTDRVEGHDIKITKGVTLTAGSQRMEVAYLLEGLPTDRELLFSVEFNFAGLPSGADDRFFSDADHNRMGQLGERLNLESSRTIRLTDEWLGIENTLNSDRAGGLWTFPIETVSQSEGGFELVHQSVVVQPHWNVRGDADGRWSLKMNLNVDTAMAKSRKQQEVAVG